jgi:hypothetical protein
MEIAHSYYLAVRLKITKLLLTGVMTDFNADSPSVNRR